MTIMKQLAAAMETFFTVNKAQNAESQNCCCEKGLFFVNVIYSLSAD